LELEKSTCTSPLRRDPNHIVEDSKLVRTRRRQHNRNQRRQIIKDGWADYEGEVIRSDDI